MDKEETRTVLKTIAGIYPSFYSGAGRKEKTEAWNLWASIFAEEPVGLVMAAVKSFVESDTKGFPPVPGQVKEKIRLISGAGEGEMTEQEAWQLVNKAIRNSGYLENAQKEHEKLPEEIRRIVTAAQLREWALMDIASVQTVAASNFQRSYRARRAERRAYEKLPEDVKRAIEGGKIKALEER